MNMAKNKTEQTAVRFILHNLSFRSEYVSAALPGFFFSAINVKKESNEKEKRRNNKAQGKVGKKH